MPDHRFTGGYVLGQDIVLFLVFVLSYISWLLLHI